MITGTGLKKIVTPLCVIIQNLGASNRYLAGMRTVKDLVSVRL